MTLLEKTTIVATIAFGMTFLSHENYIGVLTCLMVATFVFCSKLFERKNIK
jgi:hypothetical protein